MSASPVARQATNCQFIPSRKVIVNDPTQLPIDYSSTPGGTLYSTTPGGTRIVYERSFLMNLKNSPVGRTPPKNLGNFPNELLSSSSGKAGSPTSAAASAPHIALAPPVQPNGKVEPTIDEGPEQFEMDM